MAQRLGSMPKIEAALIPPEGSEDTGEVFQTRQGSRIVYRKKFINPKRTLEPVLDESGRPMTRPSPNPNMPGKMIMRSVDTFIEREFILEATPNGQVRCNFYFRKTPEEVAAEEFREREAAVSAELARELARRNMTASEMLDRIARPEAPQAPTATDNIGTTGAEQQEVQPVSVLPEGTAELTNEELKRKLHERGIDPDTLEGTGSGGRLKKADLLAALEESYGAGAY